MSHAILVTAYKDFESLLALAEYFTEPFRIFIHIDSRSKIHRTKPEILKKLQGLKQVRIIQRNQKINWGGINHLYAYLELAAAAIKEPDIKFFHLLTGQDYPIKSQACILDFFDANPENSYIDHAPLSSSRWSGNDAASDRIEYYHLYDLLNNGKTGITLNLKFIDLQKRIGFKRKYKATLPRLFFGWTYWSLNRAAMAYVINYTQTTPRLIQRLKHTFCAEETYVQTILCNSPLSDSLINNNLRYVDWHSNRGGVNPSILDLSDYETLCRSPALFARKFDSVHSKELRQKLPVL
jgi:hypothetical protein